MAPGADAGTRARRSVRLARELQAAEAALADACNEVAKAERFFPVPGAPDAGPSPKPGPRASTDADEPRQLDVALRAVVAAQAALGGVWVHLAQQQQPPGDPGPSPSQGPDAALTDPLAAGGAAQRPRLGQEALAADAAGSQEATGSGQSVEDEGAGGPAPAAEGEEGAPAFELDAPEDALAPAPGHAEGLGDAARPVVAAEAAQAADALHGADASTEPAGPAAASAAAAEAGTGSSAAGAGKAPLTPAVAAAAGGSAQAPGAGFGGVLYAVAHAGRPCKTPPCHPLAAITPSTCASAPTPAAPNQAPPGQAQRARVPHIDAATFDACFSTEPQEGPARSPAEGFLAGMPATKLFHAPLADPHLDPDPIPGADGGEQPSGRADSASHPEPAAGQRACIKAKPDGRNRAGRPGRREVRVWAPGTGDSLQRVVYPNGDEYAGEVAGGLAAGLGVYSFAGEGRYEGEVSSALRLTCAELATCMFVYRVAGGLAARLSLSVSMFFFLVFNKGVPLSQTL